MFSGQNLQFPRLGLMTMRRIVVALVLSLVTAPLAVRAAVNDAACHSSNVTTPAQGGCFVSPTGNDNTGNGTIASPWATLAKCFNEAHPGDTCWFRGGTYEAPDNSCSASGSCNGWGGWGWGLGHTQNSAYFPVAVPSYGAPRVGTGGTAGNPVTIRGYPGETPVFTQASACSGHHMLVENGVNYVSFYDITWMSGRNKFSETCSNIIFERNVFHANTTASSVPCMLSSGSNNSTQSTGWIIRNNLFIADSGDRANSCAAQGEGFVDFYSLNGALLEHNDFVSTSTSNLTNSSSDLGYLQYFLGLKAFDTANIIQYNYIANAKSSERPQRGLWMGNWNRTCGGGTSGAECANTTQCSNCANTSPGGNIVRYNVISGFSDGIRTNIGNHEDTFHNNTIYDVSSCWTAQGDPDTEYSDTATFFNNICVASSTVGGNYMRFGLSAANNNALVQGQRFINNNIYWKIGSGQRVWINGIQGPSPTYPQTITDANGITNWTNYLAGLGGLLAGDDAASRVIDPGFTSPSTGNFSLVVGAAARTGGRGGSYPTWLGADDPNNTADYVGCDFDPRCHGYSGTADTTPPTAPSNLAATAASDTQINLSWTAALDAVGVTAYRVERCQGASCTTFSEIGTTSTATYNNTGLTASTTYRYRTRAQDGAGNLGPYSNIAQATTSAATNTPPPSVSGLRRTDTH